MQHTIAETTASLIQELRVLESRLTATGAGTSLLQRALAPASIKSQIDQNEKTLDLGGLRNLVVKIIAINGCIRSLNLDFFSYVAQNEANRALWNNGIPSDNLSKFITHSGDFLDMAAEGVPMPDDLRMELNHIRKRFPVVDNKLT